MERIPDPAYKHGPQAVPGYRPPECHFCEKVDNATVTVRECPRCGTLMCGGCACKCLGKCGSTLCKNCAPREMENGYCDICCLLGPENGEESELERRRR